MPLNSIKQPSKLSAVLSFTEAFERLKKGKPEVLPKGTSISQNNVAKEAGVDPSALKKSRFPSLIAEIQHYVAEHASDKSVSARQVMISQRKRNRSLRDRISESAVQRDHLANLLNLANSKIIELTHTVTELQAKLPHSNVTPLQR